MLIVSISFIILNQNFNHNKPSQNPAVSNSTIQENESNIAEAVTENKITSEATTIEVISETNTKEENISSDILQNLVYVTPSGKKFHKADCQYVKSKNNLKELTIENAQNVGFPACSVCDHLDE